MSLKLIRVSNYIFCHFLSLHTCILYYFLNSYKVFTRCLCVHTIILNSRCICKPFYIFCFFNFFFCLIYRCNHNITIFVYYMNILYVYVLRSICIFVYTIIFCICLCIKCYNLRMDIEILLDLKYPHTISKMNT